MTAVRIGGTVAAGLGFLALLGWALGLPFLAGLVSDKAVMAPSMALLFVLYGIATFLRARPALGRGAHLFGVAVTSMGALVALLLLVLSSLGIRPAAEYLGFADTGAVWAAPAGNMSPVAAICFLLASLSFLGSLPSSSRRAWHAKAAWWTACVVFATAGVRLLASLLGSPLFYGGSFIPPAPTTSIAFAALGTALLTLANREASLPPGGATGRPPRSPHRLVLVFVLFATGIVTVGGLYLRNQARLYRAQVENQLSAVADLKTSELAQWRAERLGDAAVLHDNAAFSSLVRRLFDDPRDAEAREQLRAWLAKVQTIGSYVRLSLLDARGAEGLVVPEGQAPLSSVIARRVPEVLRSGKVTIEDFYRNEHDGRIYLTVLCPILDEQGRALGIVALRIDPETYLYQFINRWPTPAQTAEALLVRREGTDVLFLNELKFQKYTALTLRIPLARQDVAAVKAVLGQVGIVEGRDYRGVPVIAALRAVPRSPWFLVARMDAAEVNAPLRQRLWVMVLLVGAMLAAAAAGIGIFWREQRVRHLQERLETERERALLIDGVTDYAILMLDPEGRVTSWNAGAERLKGYRADEIIGQHFSCFYPEEDVARGQPASELETARSEGRLENEGWRVRKDGSRFWANMIITALKGEDGRLRGFAKVTRDLTERKRAEMELRESKAGLEEAQRIAHIGSWEHDLAADEFRFSDEMYRLLGLKPEEFAGTMEAFVACIHPDDRAAMAAFVERMLGSLQGGVVHFRVVRRDGSVRRALGRAEVHFDPSGKPHRIVGSHEDVTERWEAEQALRLARTALDQAADMIVWVNREGRLIYVNETALRLLGYSREELLGISLWQVALGESPEAWPASWEADRQSGLVAREDTFRRKDGSTFLAEVVVTHVAFGDTELQCGIVRDITERKRAEAALQELAEQLSSIYETVADVVFQLAVEEEGRYRFTSVNRAFLSATGLSHDQVVGKSVDEIIPGPSLAFVLEKYSEAIRGKRIVRWEEISDYPTGSLTGEVSISPVFDATGKCTHLVGGVHDITVRMAAEKHLAQMEGRYRGLLEAAPDAMVVVNEGGEIVLLNVQAEKQFGYRRDELIGQQVKNIIPEGFAERLIADGKRSTVDALAQQIGMGIELSARRKDGSEFPIEIMLSPLESTEGILVTAAIRDISGRKHLEAQLHQSQKLEAIGHLAGGVAHDFNNILAVILGYGELAQQQMGPEHPARERIDEMVNAAERAAGLTRQLLAFSRQQVVQPKVLDLNTIVADTQKMLGRLIGEDVDVVIHTALGLGAVKTDPGQIEQVILNLAVNARDAMPKGGRLTLETANVEFDEGYATAHPPATPGRYVLLAVSDTGIGMDEETKSRIFEPFFTTKPMGEGTGLGLATVYGIVKQSDGFIWVYTEPGRGTTFKIYLPRVDEEATASSAWTAPAEASGGTETILVAEDTEALGRMIRTTLEGRGYTVLLASDGEEALKLAREHTGPIHLLLTDVVMPKMGGGEMGKQLSALRPGIQVLYMSGYTDGVISQHGVLKEGVHLLQKPFTGRKLAQAVREALDAPEAQPPAPRKARVLLVDDDAQVRKLTTLILERAGYLVESAGTVKAASEMLGSGHEYVAILCDMTLPDGSGEDVVRRVGEARPELRDRVIVFTGGTTDEVKERLFAAGVTEVLQKPVARDVLLQRVAAIAGR